MEAYIISIKTAVLVFPAIAALLLFPYGIVQYRKYGSISFFRTVVLSSFLFYLLCIYLLVILPLPTMEELRHMPRLAAQLKPFQFARDFMRETALVIQNPATYSQALKQNCFLQPVCNIIMFLPLGIYLRYYFRYSCKQVLLAGFLISLFLEWSQLTGLYGIYPVSYRLFDVDDLLLNTFGGGLGFLLGGLAVRSLPSREEMDRRAYERGLTVTAGRRIIALLADGAVVVITSVFITIPLAAIGYLLLFSFTHGNTPGRNLVKIKPLP